MVPGTGYFYPRRTPLTGSLHPRASHKVDRYIVTLSVLSAPPAQSRLFPVPFVSITPNKSFHFAPSQCLLPEGLNPKHLEEDDYFTDVETDPLCWDSNLDLDHSKFSFYCFILNSSANGCVGWMGLAHCYGQ